MTADEPPAGRLLGTTHRFPVRVYFEDTDLSGVVYHANYLRWMERARSDFLGCVGIDQRAAFDAGEGVYAIADLSIRYLAPARLGDAVLVVSVVARVRSASVVIQQTVSRGSQKLTQAQVTAAFVSPGGRPRRQPAAWVHAFQAMIED